MARGDKGMGIRRSRTLAVVVGFALAQIACQSDFLGGSTSSTSSSSDTQEYTTQFRKVDAAGKGSITLDQANSYYAQLFTQLDTNRDGFLDANELQPLVPLMRARTGGELLQMLDRNGDGKLSQKEFLVITNWLFQRAKSANVMTLADAQSGSARALDHDTKKADADDKGKGKGGPGPR